MIPIFLSIIFIFVSFLISSIAGFAGAAFAVPLSATMIGLTNARCAVNIISIAFNSTILYQQRKYVKFRELIPIQLLMFVGMGFGVLINSYITSEEILIRILGICILLIGVMKLFWNKEIPLNPMTSCCIIFIAGIVNYLFLCGGIILVLYMSQKYQEKDAFRGSNGLIFLTNSIIMLFVQQSKGMYQYTNCLVGFLGIIPVILATLIGKRIVKRISQKQFEKVTYCLLIIMAMMLIL